MDKKKKMQRNYLFLTDIFYDETAGKISER